MAKLTAKEAAERLDVPYTTFIDWIKAGKIKAVKGPMKGSNYRIDEEELEAFQERYGWKEKS
ncbi:MAG: helix-turn-helix domain-containing protein [Chloroflexi bacterium]|nr:helix-turn-helix domain-containing protein [Chloroflexota bacterium]MCI0581110.1 helix-turn-helix domain-containing protein [Chloroflexota bacterium]MCI0648712.1 helix-turn-helix domain-containing protein [Chloroflexota bacterium]